MNELLELVGNLQDCPWANWEPATLRFCEAHVCERIVAPAETWSNLAYLFVGAWLLFRGLKSPIERSALNIQTRLGIYAVIIGIFSSLFHASQTYIFETADLAAMNLLGIEMVIQGLGRLGWMKGRSPIALSAILFAGSFLLLLGTAKLDRLLIFGAFVAVVFWLEGLIYVRERRLGIRRNYRGFLLTLLLFGIAYVFWLLDFTGLLCQPDRHWFSGHAAWHVLNAGCFLSLSSFYRSR